jgi:hypothetical protein
VVAGPVLGEHLLGLSLGGHDHEPLPVAQRGLHGVGEALADPRLGHQAVHHRVDRVLLLLVETDLLVEGEHDPVHAHPRESRLPHRLQHVLVLALPLLHQGGEDEELGARGQVRDLVDDLLRGLLRDRPAAAVAGEAAHPRPEDAQVVVDLRDGAHGGARVAARRLLLDGDRGGETADGVVDRLVHLPEELPRVGGEALDVATLPFRVEGVEGEGGLPGAGDPGEDHELLLGDLDGDVLEVVLAGSRDDDAIEFHRGPSASVLGGRPGARAKGRC